MPPYDVNTIFRFLVLLAHGGFTSDFPQLVKNMMRNKKLYILVKF